MSTLAICGAFYSNFKATVFLFVGLHHILSAAIREKNFKIKIELGPPSIPIVRSSVKIIFCF